MQQKKPKLIVKNNNKEKQTQYAEKANQSIDDNPINVQRNAYINMGKKFKIYSLHI